MCACNDKVCVYACVHVVTRYMCVCVHVVTRYMCVCVHVVTRCVCMCACSDNVTVVYRTFGLVCSHALRIGKMFSTVRDQLHGYCGYTWLYCGL